MQAESREPLPAHIDLVSRRVRDDDASQALFHIHGLLPPTARSAHAAAEHRPQPRPLRAEVLAAPRGIPAAPEKSDLQEGVRALPSRGSQADLIAWGGPQSSSLRS